MLQIKHLLYFFILQFMIFSCTKVIEVDIPSEADRLVIEGRVTNLEDYFTVKISNTLPVDGGVKYPQFPKVSDALVIISDDIGNIDTLYTQAFQNEYSTKIKKKGIPGRTYTLRVEVNSQIYTAQDILLPPPTLDSLYVQYMEAYSGIGIQEAGYYLYCDFRDPVNEKNYYRYDIRQECCLIDIKEAGVFDDTFLSPIIKNVKLPGYFSAGQYVVFYLYSLSNNGYEYYRGLSLQLQNDGGFFGTPPANAPTNLSGGALGFFLVSSIASDTLIVQ